MNVSELRDNFRDTLNRTDVSETEADALLSMGITRIERILRTAFQKRIVTTVIPEEGVDYVAIPPDYISMEWLKVNGKALKRITSSLGDAECLTGDPESFFLEIEKIRFRPDIKPGDEIRLSYYTSIGLPDDDTAETGVTLAAPDAAMYAALVFAAIKYADERKNDFASMLTELLSEIQRQADMDEMSGGRVMTNPYAGII